jgi:hypothetical protein
MQANDDTTTMEQCLNGLNIEKQTGGLKFLPLPHFVQPGQLTIMYAEGFIAVKDCHVL